MPSGELAGELAAIASAALWAFSSLAMAGVSRRMPAIAVSALRLVFGVIFYVVLLLATGQTGDLLRLSPATALALGASAILSLGFGDTLYIYGMQAIGVSRASPISVTSYPVLTLALAWALLSETVSLRTAMGTALVLGGIVLIVARPGGAAAVPEVAEVEPLCTHTVSGAAAPVQLAQRRQQGVSAAGLALVLIAAVAWALSTVWLQTLTADASLLVVNSVRVPVALLLIGGVAWNRGLLRPRSYRRQDLALLGAAGLVGSGLGSLLYVYALKEAGAGRSALLNSLSPLFALPLAAIYLRESLTRLTMAGTALALGGLWLVIG
ncbi:MAG TPA: DMT family transporter [Dehalococcoidia bacterium]|nr:DMT family transporter [Dehalococcoidia bacterium]